MVPIQQQTVNKSLVRLEKVVPGAEQGVKAASQENSPTRLVRPRAKTVLSVIRPSLRGPPSVFLAVWVCLAVVSAQAAKNATRASTKTSKDNLNVPR